MENTAALKNTLLVALASALTALGWSASIENGECLRVVGFPSLRTPEIRFSGAPSSPEVRFVWDGYAAKKPETMAARLAKFLKESADIQRVNEAAKTVTLRLNSAALGHLANLVQTRIAAIPESWDESAILSGVLSQILGSK